MEFGWILLVAGLIGVILGVLGSGGSMILVPTLIYGLDFEAKEAIWLAFSVVMVTAFLGLAIKLRQERFKLTGFVLAIPALFGFLIGTQAAGYVTDSLQLVLLACLMVGGSLLLLSTRKRNHDASPEKDDRPWRARLISNLGIGSTGTLIGGTSALSGIGGGIILVPALHRFLKIPIKQATRISLTIVTIQSVIGFVGYLPHIDDPWKHTNFAIGLMAAGALGMIVGAFTERRLNTRIIRMLFVVFLITMGTFIILEQGYEMLSGSA